MLDTWTRDDERATSFDSTFAYSGGTHHAQGVRKSPGEIDVDYVFATKEEVGEVSAKVDEIDGLAVKYRDDERMHVDLNQPNSIVFVNLNDVDAAPGNSRIQFNGGTNYISRKGLTIGVPDDDETPEELGDTHVTLGGAHNDAYVSIGRGIDIHSSTVAGETKMFMDGNRIFVTAPATVEEGQTLRAIKVMNEPTHRGPRLMGSASMQTADAAEPEAQDWHWEYESASLPTKTSDLDNDSGFTTETYVNGQVANRISDPAAKTTDQVLTWNGTNWVAADAQGGSTTTIRTWAD